MDNLSFVIWLVLWPVFVATQRYIRVVLLGEVYSIEVIMISDLVYFTAYLWIAYLLYKN